MNTFKPLLLILIQIIFSLNTIAQNLSFAKAIGDELKDEGGLCIVHRDDINRFIIGAYKQNNVLLMEMSPNGYIFWQKEISISNESDILSSIKFHNGSIYACGTSKFLDNKGFLFKFDLDLQDIVWSKQISYSGTRPFGIKVNNLEILNNSIFVIGSAAHPSEAFILEYDLRGDEINSAFYQERDSEKADNFIDLFEHDGDLYITGRSQIEGAIYQNRPFVTSINTNTLQSNWMKTYFRPSENELWRMYADAICRDGKNIIMIARSKYQNQMQGPGMAYVSKTDMSGNIIAQKVIEPISSNPDLLNISFNDVYAHQGNYYLLGTIDRNHTGQGIESNHVLICLDQDLNLLWDKEYRGLKNDWFNRVTNNQLLVNDNWIYFTGISESFSDSEDIVIYRADLNGEVGECFSAHVVESKSINYSENHNWTYPILNISHSSNHSLTNTQLIDKTVCTCINFNQFRMQNDSKLSKKYEEKRSQDIENELEVSVYPNPGKGIFQLFIYGNYEAQNNITLTNSIGQNVKYQLIRNGNNSLSLNIKEKKDGIYYLNIKNQDSSLTKKIILKN